MKAPSATRYSVKANRGIEVNYRKSLDAAIADMHKSVQYWLSAQYKKTPPLTAQDASPSDEMLRKFRELAERWVSRFDDWAPKIAESYVRRMFKASDSAFRKSLKDAGWSVEFKPTPAMRDALNGSIGENVGLIKSIPQRYLQQVEGVIMRSYTMGRDLETMVKELQKVYPVTKRRAIFIARDQSNKANAVANRTRQLELGITEAIWMHSHAGKEPRQSHVHANGKVFKIAEGCLIDGEYIQPGELPNCRCTSRPILPF